MRILFFGTYEAHRHERITVLAEGLAARGHEIAECNVPLDLGTRARVRILRFPILLPLLLVHVLGCWARLFPRALRAPHPDVVLVGYFGQLDVLLARLLWPRATVALDHWVPVAEVADDYGLTASWRRIALHGMDVVSLYVANVVLVDTDEHRELLPRFARTRTVVVPIGAPYLYFHEPAHLPARPLRVVFFGTYTPLHGTPVIAHAIRRLHRADVQISMIGQGRDHAVVRQLVGDDERVRWFDWLEPRELAGALAGHHICLGIFGVTAKASRVVPSKVYQGAAAGCAVVTGGNKALDGALGSAGITVPRGDPAALAGVLDALAASPELVASARQRTAKLAEGFTPQAVVLPLHHRLLDRYAGVRENGDAG
jgi:glycosyltransferase involved in cell wall biosynthesis